MAEKEDKIESEELSRLMVSAQQGDRNAYNQVLQYVHSVVQGYLRPKVMDAAAIDDIIQETLIAVHKARATYDGKRPLLPWVLTLARYKYVDYLRKWSRTLGRETSDEEVFARLVATDSLDGANHIGEDLEAALARLSERDRSIVIQLKLEGLSVKEVAQKLEMSESAVKVTAHRAYKKMAKYLERIRDEV